MLDKYITAGRIAREARELGVSLVKENKKLFDVAEKIERKIVELGGELAFPVNISIDSIAAHYTPVPGDQLTFKKGQVVKLDIGVHVDGYIADTAVTVEVGTNSHKELITASLEALNKALAEVRPGVSISLLGEIIENTIKSYGYQPVVNLTGHSLGRWNLHAGKSIHNMKVSTSGRLDAGDVIAIEPFATNGSGRVINSKNSDIYKLMTPKPVRLRTGREILKEIINKYKTLPFARRWFINKYGLARTSMALKQLVSWDVLYQYPILRDQEGGTVSQAEHTVIVTDEPIVTTK